MADSGTLHELLDASSRRYPHRPAVIEPGQGVIDYATLGHNAGRLSQTLRRIGVGPGDRVGVMAPKCIEAVTALFAILEAGAAYVPVDANAPAERCASIFEDCRVSAIVLDPSRRDALEQGFAAGPLVEQGVTTDSLPGTRPLVIVTPPVEEASKSGSPVKGLAYILYTSGSTGKPKGVMHTHASALSFIDWCSDALAPSPSDRFSSHAPFHFDLSILDLYVPLKHGAAIVLIGEELGKHPQQLAGVIASERITTWYSTPSILRLLVEFGRLDSHDLSALRTVLFAGEVFPLKYLRALQDALPGRRYLNLYGPTETNVCTYFEAPARIPDERSEPLPIGRPCSDDRVMVVDPDDRPVAAGSEGELVVEGGSVMVGYWNLPEQNRDAFLVDDEGRRWYRTGDLVVEEDGGDIRYVGRRDRMVKRRGYRVELGEIEVALYKHPRVSEAAVTAAPDEESGVRITAHLSFGSEERAGQIELKQFSMKNLPAYMIPDVFAVHEALPKTSTDKIDYQRLKDIG